MDVVSQQWRLSSRRHARVLRPTQQHDGLQPIRDSSLRGRTASASEAGSQQVDLIMRMCP
jgi:hypothetical protein